MVIYVILHENRFCDRDSEVQSLRYCISVERSEPGIQTQKCPMQEFQHYHRNFKSGTDTSEQTVQT